MTLVTCQNMYFADLVTGRVPALASLGLEIFEKIKFSKIHKIWQVSQFEGVEFEFENDFAKKSHLDLFLGLFWTKSAESAKYNMVCRIHSSHVTKFESPLILFYCWT